MYSVGKEMEKDGLGPPIRSSRDEFEVCQKICYLFSGHYFTGYNLSCENNFDFKVSQNLNLKSL